MLPTFISQRCYKAHTLFLSLNLGCRDRKTFYWPSGVKNNIFPSCPHKVIYFSFASEILSMVMSWFLFFLLWFWTKVHLLVSRVLFLFYIFTLAPAVPSFEVMMLLSSSDLSHLAFFHLVAFYNPLMIFIAVWWVLCLLGLTWQNTFLRLYLLKSSIWSSLASPPSDAFLPLC